MCQFGRSTIKKLFLLIFKMDRRKCNFIILCRSISAFFKGHQRQKTFPKYLLFVYVLNNIIPTIVGKKKEIAYKKG